MASAGVTKSQDPMADVRKVGYLKKLKTAKKVKKKYFVLRDESVSGPARLEYYDKDKNFSNGVLPKRSIVLKTCLKIAKKPDSKHKYGIALYAKDECFQIICDAEVEQNEWLTAMNDLRDEAFADSEIPRPLFEHIWQVTLSKKGLCNDKTILSGPYRLCLTNRTLSLIRLNHTEPDIVYELACIRRYGHRDNFFFMEVGRSTMTGEGELWMLVEDSVIAQNIHEVFISSVKNSKSEPQPQIRRRTMSNASKPITVPPNKTPSTTAAFDAATLPKRSKTMSEGSPRLRPGSKPGRGSYGHGHSPLATSPLSYTLQDEIRLRANSMDSRGTTSSLSADEQDLSPLDHLPSSGAGSTRSVTPDGPGVAEQNYLHMVSSTTRDLYCNVLDEHDISYSPQSESSISTPYITISSDDVIAEARAQQSYMEMAPSGQQTPLPGGAPGGAVVTTPSSSSSAAAVEYMDMSPSTPQEGLYCRDGLYDSRNNSYSSSPAVSTSSAHEEDRGGYLDMAPVGHGLPTVEEQVRTNDGGYLDMSPGSSTTSGSMTQLRPERMQSYISDDTTDSFPKRAYSVGSNPVKPRHIEQGYMDMTSPTVLDQRIKNTKSSSAPHLGDDEQQQQTVRPGKQDLFMELDFYSSEKWKEGFRPRTGSGGVNDMRPRTSSGGHSDMRPRTSSGGRVDMMRPRTSSFGQDYNRKRTSSFGRNEQPSGVHRTSSMSRHAHNDPHRPRTSTICQDSFRPRTSSFGTPTSEMRPRSSSYGNQHRYRKQRTFLQETLANARQHSSRHSSQESLKRSGTTSRTSQESLKSSTSMEYMDMQGGRPVAGNMNSNSSKLSSSPSHTSNTLYHNSARKTSVDKRSSPSPLVTTKNEENYMAMDFGDKSSTFSVRRASSGSSPSVENRRRLTLERLDKGFPTSTTDSAQKAPSSTSTNSTSSISSASSKSSRLKQLSNKFNAKFHLKTSSASAGENLKSSSESLSSGHGSDTRSRDESTSAAGAAAAPSAGRRSSTKRSTSPPAEAAGLPHTPGEYIDVSFDQKNLQKAASPVSGVRGGVESGGARGATFRPEHDYEEVGGEHYAMMSPTGSSDSAPKLSTSLHKVACPLSLDDASLDPQPADNAISPTCATQLVASLSLDCAPSGGQSTKHKTSAPSYGNSSPLSPAASAGVDDQDSDYFNLDLSGASKKSKESTSPSKGSAPSKAKVASKVDQSAGGSRKHSSSPLASLLHGLSQGRKSPKHKGGNSPKHSVSDETNVYSEMSFIPAPSSSPKVNRRTSSPNPPPQLTKTPPHSIVTVKPSAVHTPSAPHRAMSVQDSNSSNTSQDSRNTAATAMRSIKSTGSLVAMDVGSARSSKIHVTSPKILLTSTELINELTASSTLEDSLVQSRESDATYENMSFENKPLRQSSCTSVNSATTEPELHYAALDLSASAEDIVPPCIGLDNPTVQKSATNKSRHISGGPNGTGGAAVGAAEEESPLQYAQIDFVKSECMKPNFYVGSSASNTTVKETQMPFDVSNMALPLQASLTPPTPSDTTTAKKTQAPFDLS